MRHKCYVNNFMNLFLFRVNCVRLFLSILCTLIYIVDGLLISFYGCSGPCYNVCIFFGIFLGFLLWRFALPAYA